MEYPLNQAMQSTLAVLTKVRPEDLGRPRRVRRGMSGRWFNHFVGTARWRAATIEDGGQVADADYAAGDL